MLGKPLTTDRPAPSLARRRVTERIFVEQRADKRWAALSDEELRASIDRFLDEEGFAMQVDPQSLPATPAGRLELVNDLLHPVDENGQPIDPLISAEDARRLLDACDGGDEVE